MRQKWNFVTCFLYDLLDRKFSDTYIGNTAGKKSIVIDIILSSLVILLRTFYFLYEMYPSSLHIPQLWCIRDILKSRRQPDRSIMVSESKVLDMQICKRLAKKQKPLLSRLEYMRKYYYQQVYMYLIEVWAV